MINKYLIRLDDACPTMDSQKWQRMESLLDHYGVRPMVGVIPANDDPKQKIDTEDYDFWEKVKEWEKKGWSIALHGYDHKYISNKGMEGLNPMWARSEFAGVAYEIQCRKIQAGYAIFKKNGLNPKYFFAPSHTFDKNTLKALESCSPIRIISDTIATKPYKYGNFTFIPQLGGHCRKMIIPGMWTFCLHPSTMDNASFKELESFLSENSSKFLEFNGLNLNNIKGKDMISKIFSWIYFTQRKFKR